jgi:hypothetical protein
MMHPEKFLLLKIINHMDNGLDNLGQLEARFIDNIALIMQDYAEQTVLEAIDRLNKGEEIQVKNIILKYEK